MRDIKFRVWISKENENIVFDSGMYSWEDVKSWAYLWEMLKEGTIDLMQYTGLKDRTGKEIYEGDIVQLKDGRKRIVQWCNSWSKYNPLSWTRGEELKIIGNIHQNPKLI